MLLQRSIPSPVEVASLIRNFIQKLTLPLTPFPPIPSWLFALCFSLTLWAFLIPLPGNCFSWFQACCDSSSLKKIILIDSASYRPIALPPFSKILKYLLRVPTLTILIHHTQTNRSHPARYSIGTTLLNVPDSLHCAPDWGQVFGWSIISF